MSDQENDLAENNSEIEDDDISHNSLHSEQQPEKKLSDSNFNDNEDAEAVIQKNKKMEKNSKVNNRARLKKRKIKNQVQATKINIKTILILTIRKQIKI